MKCENCAADISIENAFCPNCGKPNKYYEAHRADMNEYERRFNETQEEITRKAGIFSRKAVFVTIISVLVALILVEIIVVIQMDEINYAIEKSRNTKNASKIAAELARYEQEGDYLDFYNCYNRYAVIKRGTEVDEYLIVAGATGNYHIFINMISKIASKSTEYDTPYDMARIINNGLTAIYEELEEGKIRKDAPRYSKQHMDTVQNIADEMYLYLNAYCNIPMDVMETFPTISETERFNILNEYIEKVLEDAEE